MIEGKIENGEDCFLLLECSAISSGDTSVLLYLWWADLQWGQPPIPDNNTIKVAVKIRAGGVILYGVNLKHYWSLKQHGNIFLDSRAQQSHPLRSCKTAGVAIAAQRVSKKELWANLERFLG